MHIGDEGQHLSLAACIGVRYNVVCLPGLTARPTPASSNARLVMASIRAPGAAQCVFADDFVHAQNLWADGVRTQRGDLGIAVVPGQNGQQPGAQHILFGRRVGAGVRQRAALDPRLVDARGAQKLSKKSQLRVGGGTGLVVPLHMDAPPGVSTAMACAACVCKADCRLFASPIW